VVPPLHHKSQIGDAGNASRLTKVLTKNASAAENYIMSESKTTNDEVECPGCRGEGCKYCDDHGTVTETQFAQYHDQLRSNGFCHD